VKNAHSFNEPGSQVYKVCPKTSDSTRRCFSLPNFLNGYQQQTAGGHPAVY